jgi:putative membrane protein
VVFDLDSLQAYCGAPPAVDQLWARWNLDPLLIISLVIALSACMILRPAIGSRDRDAYRRRSLCLYGGWAIAAAALLSPLCALSVSLMTARVAQHMVLAAVAAPLVALGFARPRPARPFEAVVAAAVFAGALWFWHAPAPYEATFRSTAIYWAMHLSAFGAALWLWSAGLAAGIRRLGDALAAAALTSLQMALLGAILTFADRPLYAQHLLTTQAWGLSPLADQQLAGVVMWIPAGVILAIAVIAGFHLALKEADLHQGVRG